MIRVVLPAHLKNLARVSGEVRLEVADPVTQRLVLDALEARTRCCSAPSATARPASAGRSSASTPARRTCPTSAPDAPLPDRVVAGAEPFIILGAMAGG